MSTRLAIVTDIHYGADQFTKRSSQGLTLVEEFARFVDDAKPDAVLELGDRITDSDHDTDLELEAAVAEAFAPIAQPRHHICGNHDLDYLSVEENERILGQSMASQTVDIGDWRLVLWRADCRFHNPGGLVLVERDLLWLAGVLRQADKPLLIASHVPVSGTRYSGHYYFEKNPQAATFDGADRVRAELHGCQHPIVWVSGHVHCNTVSVVDGIAHITQQSLTETCTTYPEPAGTVGLIELADTVHWQAIGRDSMEVRLKTPDLARRWVTPLPAFDDHPEMRLAKVQRQAAQ